MPSLWSNHIFGQNHSGQPLRGLDWSKNLWARLAEYGPSEPYIHLYNHTQYTAIHYYLIRIENIPTCLSSSSLPFPSTHVSARINPYMASRSYHLPLLSSVCFRLPFENNLLPVHFKGNKCIFHANGGSIKGLVCHDPIPTILALVIPHAP